MWNKCKEMKKKEEKKKLLQITYDFAICEELENDRLPLRILKHIINIK